MEKIHSRRGEIGKIHSRRGEMGKIHSRDEENPLHEKGKSTPGGGNREFRPAPGKGRVGENRVALTRHKTPKGVGGFT